MTCLDKRTGHDKKSSQALNEIRHTFPHPLVPGRLSRRYQRFLADVALEDGRLVTAHCPNSGSLLSCLEEGAPVRLSPQARPGRRTAFTWEMIYINGGWVGLNTLVPNRLAARAAERRALKIFEEASAVRREVRLGSKSRLDLLVERPQGPLYVEVKNVTLVQDGRALFPDAVTARGAKHLIELSRLKPPAAGAMVFVVQRSDAEVFGPAEEIDPTYAELYRQARQKGVVMTAVEAEVTPQAVRLSRELPLLV